MKYFTLLISLFFLSIAANAQKGGFALKGQLTDSLQKQQLGAATVSLVGFTRRRCCASTPTAQADAQK
ncbi:MAG TPA: hypothetical protein PK133_07980 [Ferruginibacter sp.]|jgi:hypothetical protein|nr:hypothetical protein [Ferruginibacter sp.]